MFALGIEYLTGRSVAALADRETPEWPPHPARVFMAMVAAHHIHEPVSDRDSEALRWLESLAPPAIAASAAHVRRAWKPGDPFQAREIMSSDEDFGEPTASVFVPANDRAAGKGFLQSAPGLSRKKSDRKFPGVWPEDDRVFLIWPDVEPGEHRDSLRAICSKVTRVGHSSSLVRMWIEDSPPSPTWVPDEDRGEIWLRIPKQGYLESLERSYRRDPTRLPTEVDDFGYVAAASLIGREVRGSVWDPNLPILRLEPIDSPFRHLDLVSALPLTEGLHRAVIDLVPDPVPTYVSGHESDGRPTSQVHVAYFPLAWTSHPHADGLIRGFAVALPRELGRDERRIVLRALGQMSELRLGRLGRWRVIVGDPDQLPVTLQPWAWTGSRSGSRRWGSITPVAFDRHPKGKGETYAEAVVAMAADACEHAGMPRPRGLRFGPVSVHSGAPSAHEFPRLRRKDGSRRRHVHVEMSFDEPVRGPVAIGAGRYRGYGLFRPIPERSGQGGTDE